MSDDGADLMRSVVRAAAAERAALAANRLANVAALTARERVLVLLVELMPGGRAVDYMRPAGATLRNATHLLDELVATGWITAVEEQTGASTLVRHYGARRG